MSEEQEVFTESDLPTRVVPCRDSRGSGYYAEWFREFPYPYPEDGKPREPSKSEVGDYFYDPNLWFPTEEECAEFMRDHLRSFIGKPKPKP